MCHTSMFQLVKQILMLDEEKLSEYKMQILSLDFIY